MQKTMLVALLTLLAPFSANAVQLKWQDATGSIHTLPNKGTAIVHFWASWCPPCRAEMPHLAQWASSHPDVRLIPLSLDDNPEPARRFLKRAHIPLPLQLANTQAAIRLGVRGLPTTLVIRDGRIRQVFTGAQDWQNPSFLRQLHAALSP